MKEISLHIMDLAQNSIRAGAKNVLIRVDEDSVLDVFTVAIEDDGCGMDANMVEAVRSPFVTSRTTRKVGLGIPLFAAGCENCGGELRIDSEPGRGTRVEGAYKRSHIDRPPLGGIGDTVALLIAANPELHIRYEHRKDADEYALDTDELRAILGEVPLDTPDVTTFIMQYINGNESELESMEVQKS